MDFLSNTEILLALLIVPAVLALDWAIRNGDFFTSKKSHLRDEDDLFDSEDGWTIGSSGYGYYSGGIQIDDNDD